jgi:hypothetical protein
LAHKEATRAGCTGGFLGSASSPELFAAGHGELAFGAAAEDFGEVLFDVGQLSSLLDLTNSFDYGII